MQLRPELKKAMAVGAGLLAVCCLIWFAAGSRTQAFELRVDGELLGFVDGESTVKSAVDSIVKAESAKRGVELLLASKVETQKANEAGTPLKRAELESVLRNTLQFAVKACVIQVEGKEAVALSCKAEAEAALVELKAGFEGVARKAGTLLSLDIVEQIAFVEKAVPADSIKNRADAKNILIRGTDNLVLYTVKKGDSLWSIAKDNNTTVDKLRAGNPDLKGDRLDIGQKVNLTVATPFINIVTLERVTSDVRIGFRTEVRRDPELWPWQSVVKQPGVYGKKEVTFEIKKQNGREIARQLIDERHVSDPSTQIVVQGSKMTADMGTGQFAWPAAGQISSRYGQRRSGFHHGVDIAAPMGTPVQAADSGTVVIAGYRAYYGNMIMLDHGGGKVITVYGHLSKILVKVGDIVEKGDIIGNVGSTGRSTGPHLHFEIRVEGSNVNPITHYPLGN